MTQLCAENDLYRFEPETKTWTDLSQMTTGLDPPKICGHRIVSLGHNIYSYGGSSDQGSHHITQHRETARKDSHEQRLHLRHKPTLGKADGHQGQYAHHSVRIGDTRRRPAHKYIILIAPPQDRRPACSGWTCSLWSGRTSRATQLGQHPWRGTSTASPRPAAFSTSSAGGTPISSKVCRPR